MKERIERLRALLEEPLLVTSPVNIRYLVGLESSNAALLVEPARLRLLTDFRYAERARAVEGVEVVELARDLFAGLPGHLPGRVAFEADELTFDRYEALAAARIDLVPRRELVKRLRAVKDDRELGAIRAAAAITNEAFARLARERFVGRTERELAWRLESLLHELGADGPAFDVTVAAGPTGAAPHADSGDRAIEAGEAVVVDAGARLAGYCSDCTRTFATGPLPEELARSYEACLEAQAAALAAVAPGRSGADVDGVARAPIAGAGLSDLFGHGLGHGVGLEVHELPILRPESEDVLEPGNVVTVEPGIYHPGLGGIRIEDLVAVTEEGADVLTTFPKELTSVH